MRAAGGELLARHDLQLRQPAATLPGNLLFCDGGVIGSSRSAVGGAWAFRAVMPGGAPVERWGAILPDAPGDTITAPMAELLAACEALEWLLGNGEHVGIRWGGKDRWTFLTDCLNVLGWLWLAFKQKNVHPHLAGRMRAIQKTGALEGVYFMHLDGHPTAAQLETGIGKRGGFVSEHNKWCDDKCNEVKARIVAGRPEGLHVTYL